MAHIMFFSVAARESREPVITQFSLSLWNFRLVLKLLFWTDLRATANNRKRKEKKNGAEISVSPTTPTAGRQNFVQIFWYEKLKWREHSVLY